jgi:hypothetical protein
MPTLELDAVEDTEVVQTGAIKECVRTGWVKDMYGSNVEEGLVNVLNLAGMPQQGDPLSVANPDLTLRSVRVRPSGVSGKRKLEMRYSNFFGAFITAITTENRLYLASQLTDFLPGTRIPFTTQLDSDDGTRRIIPPDTLTLNIPMPMREMTISAVAAGDPDEGLFGIHFHTNSDTFLGKPAGYWLGVGISTRSSKYDPGYSAWSATILSNEIMDWSISAIMINQQTGRKASVVEAEIAALMSPGYAYGIRGLQTGPPVSVVNNGGNKGVIRVGPFPTANFGAILGI